MTKSRTLDQIQQAPTLLGGRAIRVGNLKGKEDLFVRCKVVGDCDIQGMVLLSPGSYWLGNITADVVIINGTVEGNITARTKLELRDAARVRGNLISPMIAISQGAKIYGDLSHDGLVTLFNERRLRAPKEHEDSPSLS
jgi:cytoskeletal protein CcmA (bactofilin family)